MTPGAVERFVAGRLYARNTWLRSARCWHTLRTDTPGRSPTRRQHDRSPVASWPGFAHRDSRVEEKRRLSRPLSTRQPARGFRATKPQGAWCVCSRCASSTTASQSVTLGTIRRGSRQPMRPRWRPGSWGSTGRRRSRWASMSPAPIGVVCAAAGHDCSPHVADPAG